MSDKKWGGLYGAIIGDAVGVSYEFTPQYKMPPDDEIDIIPRPDWRRPYPTIKSGTYSDDSAQMLCLLELLLNKTTLFLALELHTVLQAWWREGYMSVDGITFDVGNQTAQALGESQQYVEKIFTHTVHSGNGSLMRVLPVALVVPDKKQAMEMAMEQSKATHPNLYCRICCALYVGTAFDMLHGKDLDEGLEDTVNDLKELLPDNVSTIDGIYQSRHNEIKGSGYVIDSLWSAIWAVRRGKSYEEVIKLAIGLGNDTDTTACIAGGLAGIKYGLEGIPTRWVQELRGNELIRPLANRLVEPENVEA